MWKGETSGARKDRNLLELEATDAGSGSDTRRGRVCRATLAATLSEHTTDASVLLWQTQCVSVRRGDVGTWRRSSAATDAARVWWFSVGRVYRSFSWNGAYWTAYVGATDTRACERCTRLSIWARDHWISNVRDTWHSGMRQTPRLATDASDVHDFSPTALFEGDTSINIWWPALDSYSWTFDIFVSTLSWVKASSLISTHLLCIRLRSLSEIEWFKCIDHWFASRDTWVIDLLRCFLLLLVVATT
jgi:hypothetical protein